MSELYQKWQELPPVMKIIGFFIAFYAVFKGVPVLVWVLQAILVIVGVFTLFSTGLMSPFLNQETIDAIDSFLKSLKKMLIEDFWNSLKFIKKGQMVEDK